MYWEICFMKKMTLVHAIFFSIFLGIVSGLLFHYFNPHLSFLLDIANFLSTIFLRLLKMIIVPLIITSIISGVVSSGESKNLGSLGLRTMAYYLTTSLFAIVLGLILVNLIQPGVGVDLGLTREVNMKESSFKDILDIFIRMIPSNFFDAASKGQMLPIIFFSLLFGICLLKTEDSVRKNTSFIFTSCFSVIMKMTNLILYVAPLGIWGLMTKLIATSGFSVFIPLGWYTLTVFLALMIHSCFVLPCLVYFISKKSPVSLLSFMKVPLLTAFSTASSSATLPLTISSLEEKGKVSNKVSGFVLPLGATINMDGTALYECIAVVFIAQAYGIELGLLNQILIVMTALLASIGAAGIPMAGLVMMSVVLSAVGLPLEGVGLIIAVDRVLDMCRTTVNVWSDSCGAYILDSLESEDKKYSI